MLNRKRVKIGDIFQILTTQGVCYGLVTHKHPTWAYVVAIFRDFYGKEPKDFTDIVAGDPQFITTFVIQQAVTQGLFALVANVPVPKHLSEFPTFRSTNNLKGDDTLWFFWKGDKELSVKRPLTDKEKNIQKAHHFQAPPFY